MRSLLVRLCLLFSLFVYVRSEIGQCGEIRKKDSRIVGGKDVEYLKYPWYTALFQSTGHRSFVCGGSLISNQFVLTAAHCYKPYLKKKGTQSLEDVYEIKLGVTNKCIYEKEVEVYKSINVYINENYLEDYRYGDIAIIKLNAEVKNFIPICLPTRRYASNNRTGLIATIVGLGKNVSSASSTPCIVKEAEVVIRSDSRCKMMLSEHKENGTALHDAFCAGSGKGDIDTCQGDSGGPLQITKDNIKYLLGITSFGFGCAKKNTYGIYTDVSHFLDWIYKIIENIPPSSIRGTRPQPQERKPTKNIIQQIFDL